jgi:hypothetical protein
MHLRSTDATRRSPPPGPRPLATGVRISLAFLLMALVCVGTLALPGCGGCWSDDATTAANKKKEEEKKKEDDKKKKKKKKAEKPKPDFEDLRARTLPSNDPSPTQRVPEIRGKPGHWTVLSVTAKANNYDFPGELVTYAEEPATNFPMLIENTSSRLSISRPASLPKGQSRPLPTLVYLPRKETGRVYSLRTELRGSRGGSAVKPFSFQTGSMKDYQFLIVVLASNPSSYTHLDKAHSIRMPQVEVPGDLPESGEVLQHYFVVRPNVEKGAPLPAYPLAWTNTAFVIWDDINPDVLTKEQLESLIDWIHWGGQLIISGPGSLDKLKGKPLAAYLPGESTEALKLEQTAFDDLNRVFSLQRDPSRRQPGAAPPKDDHLRRINITSERPMVGVALKLHPEAHEIEGTGGLVVERRVGGGRIVVSRFPLTDVRVRQWKNFDGFLNAVLLRRPARVFDNQNDLGMLNVRWVTPELGNMLQEPRIGSTLRYFSRDIGSLENKSSGATSTTTTAPTDPSTPMGGATPAPVVGFSGAPVMGAPGFSPYGYGYDPTPRTRNDTSKTHPPIDDWHFLGYESTFDSGVAAWNDQGAASLAARQALTEAAGIEIPRADFVIKVLAVYLLVLVPLNWALFWLLGRVEWAWLAAPVIAIVGAGTVVRLAQLDIGFARSRTEIAVLEMQGNYERAHLTRYTALYTSLSSTYTLAFDEQSALALPFSSGKRDQSPFEINTTTNVHFHRDKQASLTGVKVSSNSTGMVHSEQMYPLGRDPKLTEALALTGDEQKGYSLRNTTELTIRDVGIFRRREDIRPTGSSQPRQQIETAYVAELKPQTSVALSFRPLQGNSNWLPEWNRAAVFAGSTGSITEEQKGRVRLTSLAGLATQQLRLVPGDVRLVGWTDEALSGMQISPHAPQNNIYTLVLAHLVRGSLPAVVPDKNVAEDYFDPTIFDTEPSDPNDPNAPMLEPADPNVIDPGTLQPTP